ncbi:MAG: glycoside hydrolase family 15 protein, partial [Actinomycetota bacterium]
RARGYDEELGTYTQAYGWRELDASVLALATSDIEPRDSPRLRGTIRMIQSALGAGGPLLYRFRPEGEGAFLPCSFWVVRALAAIGEVAEAREVMEQACSFATDLGLFAEHLDPSTGEHMGNFPQAFTHAALVDAAAALGKAEQLRATGTFRGSLHT